MPRRLSSALREALLLSSSCSSSAAASGPDKDRDGGGGSQLLPALSPDALALVSALASALLSVDARGLADACAAAERALSPGPAEERAAPPFPSSSPSPPLPPLPLPLAAAAFDALGRAIGSADDLLRKSALARWWARAASRVGVAAGR